MKLYVDELPKCCQKCPYCDTKYGRCDLSGSRVEYFGCHALTPLSDYTKQVRKEVLQEIRKWCDKNFNWVGDGTGYDGQDYNEMIGSNNTINKLRKLLDQIQGE